MKMDIEKMAIEITEKEYKILPMGKYPASVSGCNMEEDKPKEDKYNCDTCIKDDVCIFSNEYETEETCPSFVSKQADERFICNSCRRKDICDIYKDDKDYMENFLKVNSNNKIKCVRYIK